MDAGDQLTTAGRKDRRWAAARANRWAWAARRPRRAASPLALHTGGAPGGDARVLRSWAQWPGTAGRPAGLPLDGTAFPGVFPSQAAGPATGTVPVRQAVNGCAAGLVTAGELERRRLRRELHDSLGPALAGLVLGLDTAWVLSAGQPELQELLGALKAETQRAVADLRGIVYGLRPPVLDELGLAGAVREQVGRLACQAPGLAVSVQLPGDGLAGLPGAVEVAVYRVVAEALANVARHARAARCVVRIGAGDGVWVEVADDGAGLPAGWRAGVGICSMRERVSELGGQLLIGPRRPHGTRVAAWLPVRERP